MIIINVILHNIIQICKMLHIRVCEHEDNLYFLYFCSDIKIFKENEFVDIFQVCMIVNSILEYHEIFFQSDRTLFSPDKTGSLQNSLPSIMHWK